MVVYISYITAARKFHQLTAEQLLSGQPVRYGKSRRYGPSITYKITPAGSLSSSQPGGPPCWASPLAFGLIDDNLFLSLSFFWVGGGGKGEASFQRQKNERGLLYIRLVPFVHFYHEKCGKKDK
jgi:hypothetical protein